MRDFLNRVNWRLLGLCLGTVVLMGSIGLAWKLEIEERGNRRDHVNEYAHALLGVVRADLDHRLMAYERMVARWKIYQETSDEVFIADAEVHYNDLNGIKAIEWVDPEYHVRWLVPQEGNEAVINFDLSSQENCLVALDAARNDRRTVLTKPIDLVQGGQGSIFFIPVYAGDRIEGFLSVVIEFSEWLNHILASELLGEGNLYSTVFFLDGRKIYQHNLAEGLTVDVRDGVEDSIFGLPFGIECAPTPALIEESQTYLPEWVAATGTLLALFLAAFGRVSQENVDVLRQLKEQHNALELEVRNRRSAELELVREHERLLYILRGTNVGSWEWNVQTGETVFNERWAEIIGYTLKELAPVSIETWKKFSHPSDVKKSQKLLRRVFDKEAEFYEMEIRMRHRNGSWVWTLDCGKVFSWTEDGRPLMMFGTHQDITERKNTEERIKRLERLFFHDILNTAGNIQGLIELEKDEVRGSSHEELVQTLGSLSQILIEEIEAQRSLLGALGGELSVNFTRVVSLDILQQVVDIYRYGASLHDVAIRLDPGSDTIVFESDQALLVRVLGNLVKNAIEASMCKDTIEVSCRNMRNEHVRFSVHNETLIPEKVQQVLFKESVSTKAADRGIGTQSVKILVETYLGGRVHFTSNEEGGTSFHVDLPIKPPAV